MGVSAVQILSRVCALVQKGAEKTQSGSQPLTPNKTGAEFLSMKEAQVPGSRKERQTGLSEENSSLGT